MRCPTCRTDLALAAMFDAALDSEPADKRLNCICPACEADFALEIRGNRISLGRRRQDIGMQFEAVDGLYVTCLHAYWAETGGKISFADRLWVIPADRREDMEPRRASRLPMA